MLLNKKFAYITIPAIYLVAGLLWITFSDAILVSLSTLPGWVHGHFHQLATYKGYFYVAVTSVLLGVLIRSAFRSVIAVKNDFKRLFAENPNPMWIYDEKTLKFLLVNDAACRAYGYTHEEFYKMNLFAIRPVEEYDRLKDIVTKHQPGLFTTEKWLHKGKDGVPFYVNIFANDTLYPTGAAAW
ncbi:MAG TPA: PAS domain S-box protein [Cyclobacteriaceae bacterium]|nr:PAS domain S-box protein [Cyclobacteriaceae bacterium]HMV08451.1 PAS domain S-box protein [Cyclobacteriaceae bacterium]HMV91661.1 PAS domain S-box protein [Cyclobacteriaceae bacterium]HMX01224.1 PAS domain S-box protein [Cyclobacteriaceae bacterium]HMX50627.1 PAS domain S-box protein [Cyclobacteriaceae bacterium]